MPDRIDIDALLIGALYGELTPVDEALLAAHLESHPTDRTALADLTRTRAAVRDSRLLAVQLEPPQSISALLLQEASRRAPRPPARDRETASWFQRFVRSFMAHPAMAAAAMLVLVVSVAGTFYLRGTDLVAESPPPQVSVALSAVPPKLEATGSATPPTGAAPAAPAPEPEAAHAGAGSGGYRVDLDDSARAQQALAKQGDLSTGGDKAKAGLQVADGVAVEAQAPASKQFAPAPAAPAAPRATRGDKPTKSGKKLAGIEVRTPELSPRELKESDDEAPDRARGQSLADRDIATATGRITRGAGPGARGGGAAPAAAMPAPVVSAPDQAGSEPAPAFEPGAVAKKAANDAEPEPKSVANSRAKNEANNAANNVAKLAAKKPVDKPSPSPSMPQKIAPAAPPPPSANDNRFAAKPTGPAKDTAGPDRSLIDWARKRHEQVKTLVSSNNCRAAASAATEIYSRAPDYYAANVVTDRTIKPCLPYLNTEREREDRVRAAKNAAASDSAAPVPPPTRK